jgi:serine/threonine protein kinase/tetratricopeptide (TPR) repeat protein
VTVSNESDDEIRHANRNELEGRGLKDSEFDEGSPAYQKVEALFDLLRRPATDFNNHNSDELAAGSVLGGFTVLRPLASGGMGHVYLARQESLSRLIALKVCKREIARDSRMKSRFLAEGVSLARLAHPNVVPVLSSGEDQDFLYLAMEYVAGPTLAEVLQAVQGADRESLASAVVGRVLASSDRCGQGQAWSKGHAIPDRAYQTWVVQVLQQVAEGLAAAHAAGILHRDIKPANVVFAANGVPKLVDFGLARTTHAPSTTATGEFYGTPAYTSPEQARGDQEAVKPSSDVFSFGVMLFECLSLRLPFQGRSSIDVLSAILNSDAPLLRKVEKRIPSELEAITDKCVRKNQTERYLSGRALADDLRNYLELRPTVAKPPSKFKRAGRMIRRRPWVTAFYLVLICAAVLGGFLARHVWADYKAGRRQAFAKRVDEGDVALFRCLTGQRPTWLPTVIEQHRQQGIGSYTAALEIDPRAIWPLVQRSRLYAANKDSLNLALDDLEKALQLQPGYASIRKFRGLALQKLGRSEEALADREEAKKYYPTASDDLYWLGVIAYSSEHDFVAAHDYFSRALLLQPVNYWSRLERADFGRAPREQDSAVRNRVIPELQIAKAIRPDLPFASEVLATFYSTDRLDGLDGSRWKKELAEQIERFGLDIPSAHNMAELLQKENKYDEARTILDKVLEQDSGGVTAEKIGDLEYSRKEFEKARDWYIRAIKEGTNHPYVYSHLADSFTALKDWKGAEKAYLDGIGEHPATAYLFWNLGRWYEARYRLGDAEKFYRTGCELPEIDSQCYKYLAYLLGRVGRRTESVQVLKLGIARLEKAQRAGHKGQSRDDDESSLKELLGKSYIFDGRPKDAISLIESELTRRPLTFMRANFLVNLLNQLGLQQAALEVSNLAEFSIQQQDPTFDTLQPVRSLVDNQLRQMGHFKELRDRLETRRALGEEMGPTDYRWLGVVYQGTEALAILAEGVKKHPTSVELQSDHLQSLAQAGRKEEAWNAYETARDLYFVRADTIGAPARGHQDIPLPPTLVALPWYTFLLQAGKDDEFSRLDDHLRKVCTKMMTDPNHLLLPRAFAEFSARKYEAAARSLEGCLQLQLWNEIVSETMIVGALARSFRALGRRKDAIKSYRRAVGTSSLDPALLSELLCVVVEEEGVVGLLRELPALSQGRVGAEARQNATLSCFNAWLFLAGGNEKLATEYLLQAVPYVLQAGQQLGGDEGVACAVIIRVVAEKLGDSRRLAIATDILRRYPVDRVKKMQEILVIPKRG